MQTLQKKLEGAEPKVILQTAFASFEQPLLSFSGAEDVALIDMALKVVAPERISVFTLDSGRLHPETYRFIDRVREHYGLHIDVLLPASAAVDALVREKGMFSFYRDGHQECCSIRKIEPLRRHLAQREAWITGQRRDQSPSTRSNVQEVMLDPNNAPPGRTLVKFNPLVSWSSAQVWEYIRMFDVPCNELHERGFVSIGCEPCTRAVGPGQHEREGRWWWEEATIKECGLHGTGRPEGVPAS